MEESSKKPREDPSKIEETKKDFEERLIDFHPRFLGIVRDVYPLAVLGSLCIAIAAFTSQTYPEVQASAVTAAALFLVAFVSSFLFRIRIFSTSLFAFISYGSTFLAILFLFLVVMQFSSAVPLVSKTMMIIPAAFVALVMGSLVFYFTEAMLRSKYRTKALSLFSLVSIISGALFIVSIVADTTTIILGVETPNYLSDLLLSSISVCLASTIAVIVLLERKKEAKTLVNQQ